jgi:hypothetical protein
VLEELGGAQEALEDPQLEQVALPEAHKRDRRSRRAFESLRHCVEQREVLEVRRGGEPREEHIDVDGALGRCQRADRGGAVHLGG